MPSSLINKKNKKGGAFKYADMFSSSLSPCTASSTNNKRGGSSPIHTFVDYSQDWHNANAKNIPYAVDSSAGINEYIFGRTTPDNQFIVATGLVQNKDGIEMTGGKKRKGAKKTKKTTKTTTKAKKTTKTTKAKKTKRPSTLNKVKKTTKLAVNKIKSSSKSAINKVKKSSKSVMNKVKSSSKSAINKVKKSTKSLKNRVVKLFK